MEIRPGHTPVSRLPHLAEAAGIRSIAACPVCVCARLRRCFEVRHIVDDPLFAWARHAGYSCAEIVECSDCGFAFKGRQPEPELLAQHYAETGEDYQSRLAEDDPAARGDFAGARRFLWKQLPRGGRVLDVGCGRGFFLKSLGAGWELCGVEPSASAAEFAKRQHGVQAHCGDFFSAGCGPGSFDAVTMLDVVEHLTQPAPMFAEARRILKPGGWLVVGTGNWGALTARLAGKQWAYLAIPDHLSFFSVSSLGRALAVAGFSRVSFQRLHHGPRSWEVTSGWMRAVLRHRAISRFGPGVTRLPLFRSKGEELPVPYFWDHLLSFAS